MEGDVVGVTDSEDVTMAENENKVDGQQGEENGIVSNTEVTEEEGRNIVTGKQIGRAHV